MTVEEEHFQPTLKTEETTRQLESKEDLSQSVPGFRLLQKLGEGGMGEVFEAEQLEPVRRKVALKLIKRGMESKEVLARFDAERQALALMSHPNIAQVYDAGTTADGRPYFVMEFIQGVPVTRYCDTNRLTTEERLELFTQVCDGVQHAHHKGVIHRDIKPSNVLVKIQDSKAVPKIIDFGVAKAIAQRLTEQSVFTAIGEFIGTPEYMSPEQAEMTELDIDTRTDVYSLGVVLYEMLVGAPPFDARELLRAGFSEMRRKIREDEPPRPSVRLSGLGEASTTAAEKRRSEPSTLARQLHGDLDWITMKALEKDRTRRYNSPGELAADVSRHLRNEPVLAGPPSATYRVKKFVRRHTLGVAAGVFVALALILGVAGITLGLVRAREAERVASREAETATQISDFLIGLFEVSDPNEAKGETITAREILDRGSEQIRTALTDQPLVQARLMRTMGRVYHNLGLYEEAQHLLRRALDEQRAATTTEGAETARTLVSLAMLLLAQDQRAEAREMLEEALSVQERTLGPQHPELTQTLNQLGFLLAEQGDFNEAKGFHNRALSVLEAAEEPDQARIAISLSHLASIADLTGDYETARSLHDRVVRIEEHEKGPDDPVLVKTLSNLAVTLKNMGDYAAAIEQCERALAIAEKVYGPDHEDVALVLSTMATAEMGVDDFEAAKSHLERAAEIYRTTFGPEHASLAVTLGNLAIMHSEVGEYGPARERLAEARVIFEKSLGPNHHYVASCLHNEGIFLMELGDLRAALPTLERALDIREQALGSDHPHVADSLGALAELHVELGDAEKAETLFRQSLAIREDKLGADHPKVTETLEAYADLLRTMGRESEAEELSQRAAGSGERGD